MAIEYVSDFLFAVDLKGDGVKQTLWTQRYSPEYFFTTGQADQVTLKDGKLSTEKTVRVPSTFRPMGAAFSNVMGKDTRSLALIDEFNRLADRERGRGRALALLDLGGRRVHVHRAGRRESGRPGPSAASSSRSSRPRWRWTSTATGSTS